MLNYVLVKRIMKEQDINQTDLVDRLNEFGIKIRIDGVKSWFRHDAKTRNTPKTSTIQALATILEVSVESLINKEINAVKPVKVKPKILSSKFQSETMLKFIDLFNEYGNEKMILPVIEKLEKMKEIAES